MAQFCQICGQITNCTDNCNSCLAEQDQEQTPQNDLLEDLMLEQREQGT